jgi:hypothetical protein
LRPVHDCVPDGRAHREGGRSIGVGRHLRPR